MKILGSTKSNITKMKLEINEAVSIHCNIATYDYQQDSKVLYTIVLNKYLVNY